MSNWLKLIGIAVAATGLILLVHNFVAAPPTPPSLPPPPIPEKKEEVTPEAILEIKKPKAKPKQESKWNVEGTQIPPRPKVLADKTKQKVGGPTGGAAGTDGKKGGAGGGAGGGAAGGSGGGAGAGGATGAATGDTGDGAAPDTGETYWIQTGPDPLDKTQVDDRHRRGCPKYKNVPGREGTKEEGNACPICGG